MLAPLFSAHAILGDEDVFQNHLNKFTKNIELEVALAEDVDITEWFCA